MSIPNSCTPVCTAPLTSAVESLSKASRVLAEVKVWLMPPLVVTGVPPHLHILSHDVVSQESGMMGCVNWLTPGLS